MVGDSSNVVVSELVVYVGRRVAVSILVLSDGINTSGKWVSETVACVVNCLIDIAAIVYITPQGIPVISFSV